MIFLDELFASIDGNGQSHIINILRKVVKDYQINIFAISHYPLPAAEFDWRIKIHKNNGYSTFELEKIE
jgi:ABC-type multidrug transport system ATPase subunit